MDPPTLFQIAGVSFYEELLQNNTISYSRYGYTVFYNAVSEQPRVEAGNAPTKVLFVNLMTTRGPVSSRNSSREIGDPEICLSIAPLAKKWYGLCTTKCTVSVTVPVLKKLGGRKVRK